MPNRYLLWFEPDTRSDPPELSCTGLTLACKPRDRQSMLFAALLSVRSVMGSGSAFQRSFISSVVQQKQKIGSPLMCARTFEGKLAGVLGEDQSALAHPFEDCALRITGGVGISGGEKTGKYHQLVLVAKSVQFVPHPSSFCSSNGKIDDWTTMLVLVHGEGWGTLRWKPNGHYQVMAYGLNTGDKNAMGCNRIVTLLAVMIRVTKQLNVWLEKRSAGPSEPA